MKDFVDYWANKFDWRKQEKYLNSFKQYRMDCGNIDLHFVHERSKDPAAIPLVLLHGWPCNFTDFHKMIHPLAMPVEQDGKQQSFHVVVPSMPGFAFSGQPKRPGYGPKQMGEAVNNLMLKLGYNRYVAQGGDFGGMVAYVLGALHPEHCAAVHSNITVCLPSMTNPWTMLQMANASLPMAKKYPVFLSADDIKGLEGLNVYMKEESGYAEIQKTKPDTIGYALNDSPAGLLAWIIEKMWRWVDGELEACISRDELLTSISLFWFTQSITSSMRLYREAIGPHSTAMPDILKHRCTAPTAIAVFPKEIWTYPKSWCAKQYNLKRWTIMPAGGHFAALEKPELLMADMRAFFATYH
ncbi:g12452 [Coccomyxa viridis]|uniref:G12452 protein n=1 Tax=Coccomyxa viridis TaxID=1274662 RepID=A0ABP1GBE7_9CHLO